MVSPKAAGLAASLGYKNSYAFRDGLPAWIKAGYPVETTEKLPKAKVPNVNVSKLKKMLDGKQDFVLLDIRMPFAAKTRWIKCSNRLSIPLDDLTDRHPEIPSGKKIVIIDELLEFTVVYLLYVGYAARVAKQRLRRHDHQRYAEQFGLETQRHRPRQPVTDQESRRQRHQREQRELAKQDR